MDQENILDAGGVVIVDLDCRRCGYNLIGLQARNRCPECGTSITMSTRGDALRFSDPEWLERVSFGLRLILWMIPVFVLLVIVGFVLVASGVSDVIMTVLMFAAALVTLMGVWNLTTPEPSVVDSDKMAKVRKVIRIAFVISLLESWVELASEQGGFGGTAQTVFGFLVLVTGLASLVTKYGLYMLYEHLSDRIPNQHLARRARFLRIAYSIALIISIVSGALLLVLGVSMAGGMAPGRGLMILAGCTIFPASLAIIVFEIMTLILLINLNRELRMQLELARHFWQPSGPSLGTSQDAHH